MHLVFATLAALCSLYVFVLFVRVVFDVVMTAARDWRPTGFFLVAANLTYRLTDPPLRFLAKYIPPLRFGGVQLDMGFLVLFFGVQILSMVFRSMA
ncbi:MAG: YggT family protein [Actinomycetaceae bacterium]|jgi:YggT family protein|nr:YggT family protein [Actinomycetaceae bacterium]